LKKLTEPLNGGIKLDAAEKRCQPSPPDGDDGDPRRANGIPRVGQLDTSVVQILAVVTPKSDWPKYGKK
jgi:hypothetical protein